MTEEKQRVRPKIVWCDPCNGQGWCMVKDVPFECMCGHLKRVAAGMLPYVKNANVENEHVRQVEKTFLTRVSLPMIPRPRDNLFVEGHWGDMCAIVKILMMMGTNGHVKIADENELRDVYVGSFSKASKSADFTGVVYNSISDFVGPPDLLIIRLNTLTNKNKAVPGVLLESVKTRYDYGKSTWLLSDLERPFNPHSLSYSEEAGILIASAFDKVTLPKINKRESEQVQSFFASGSLVGPVMSLEAEPSQQDAPKRRGPKIGHNPEAEPERRPRRKQGPEDESVGGLGSIYGAGVESFKSKFRKS